MSRDSVPPSINKTAFDCPHCGAYTTQYWLDLYANSRDKNSTPFIPDEVSKLRITENTKIPEEEKQKFLAWCERMDTGLVQLKGNDGKYVNYNVENLHLSRCYNCNKVSVWNHGILIFPKQITGIQPNPDLPDSIIKDFNEARSIVDDSPRGAAALLRLCVQKLCKELGESGKDIDKDIASLVTKGLNPLVQQSLDIVRVIGNESVHPGTIDLNDDKETAIQLLGLINSIVDQMISHPKKVEELYNKLPEGKRKAIEVRDGKVKT